MQKPSVKPESYPINGVERRANELLSMIDAFMAENDGAVPTYEQVRTWFPHPTFTLASVRAYLVNLADRGVIEISRDNRFPRIVGRAVS